MGKFHCVVCHNFLAEGDKGDNILPESKRCLSCHKFMKGRANFPEDHPMNFACPECHKPHTQPFLTREDCLSCYEDIKENDSHIEFGTFEQSLKCTECHTPHSWKYDG